jgi:hypothetical protein
LLHRHRDVAVRRETNLVAFYVGHEAAVDVVMMASVSTLATVSLGEFDAVLFDPIDGADMDAVSANYFHMLVGAVRLVVPRRSRGQCSRNPFAKRRSLGGGHATRGEHSDDC